MDVPCIQQVETLQPAGYMAEPSLNPWTSVPHSLLNRNQINREQDWWIFRLKSLNLVPFFPVPVIPPGRCNLFEIILGR